MTTVHEITIKYNSNHFYAYQAVCECGYASEPFETEGYAKVAGQIHFQEVADHIRETLSNLKIAMSNASPLDEEESELDENLRQRISDVADRLDEETSADELPSYYKNSRGQNIDSFIGELEMRRGNIIKYVFRAGRKPNTPTRDDLIKARNVIDLWLKDLDTAEDDTVQ